MQHWKLYEIETPDGSRSPVVLHSQDGDSRVVLIALEPELCRVAARIDDHCLARAAICTDDVAVRPRRSELVAVDGKRHRSV